MALEIKLLNSLMAHEKLALAVSGGPDSMALMGLAHQWCAANDKQAQKVHVLSVDHGLREGSGKEADDVYAGAEALGFSAKKLKLNWGQERPTAQAQFRDARYEALFGYMAEHDIEALGLAHHADDQAETILMRLAHKSGLEGLSGMKAQQERHYCGHKIQLYRPFLSQTKQQLKDFCAEQNVRFVTDPSNHNEKFERVRVRAAWPQLEELGLNADILSQFAARTQRSNEALNKYARAAIRDFVTFDHLLCAQMQLKDYRDLPDEIGIRLLSILLDMLGGAARKADLSQIEQLQNDVLHGIFGIQSLGGCLIHSRADELCITREIGRLDQSRQVLDPKTSIQFDQRYTVTNFTDKSLEVAPLGTRSKKWFQAHLPHLQHFNAKARASTPAVYKGDEVLQALDFQPFGALAEIIPSVTLSNITD